MKRRSFLGLLAKLPIIVAAAPLIELAPAPADYVTADQVVRTGLPEVWWRSMQRVLPVERPTIPWFELVPDRRLA